MDLHVFPIPIPPPTSVSTQSLWVFPVHQARALISCIQPGLVICFRRKIVFSKNDAGEIGYLQARQNPCDSDGKESACNTREPGLIPRQRRSPGEGNGYPLQYSCLENSKDRRSWAGYSPWDRKESDTTEQITKTHRQNINKLMILNLDLILYKVSSKWTINLNVLPKK